MDHKAIIEELGGHKGVAAALGVRENAVCHWKSRGIPPFYWSVIVGMAGERGLDLSEATLRNGRRMKHHDRSAAVLSTAAE